MTKWKITSYFILSYISRIGNPWRNAWLSTIYKQLAVCLFYIDNNAACHHNSSIRHGFNISKNLRKNILIVNEILSANGAS